MKYEMNFFKKHRAELLCLSLILAICIVYWQVTCNEFINYDDDTYIFNNKNVIHGLNVKAFLWAFTSFYAANWHPLTWLSHMLDCRVFGLNPGMHHLVNVLFHTANTLLLFVVFHKMTGALWKSAFVAALFGLHPLHVESVAWAAERKDVLSTFFGLLTLWAYIRYVRFHGMKRYLLVVLLFSLSLMAKPMLVTLPFVLLLLDYWPLERLHFSAPSIERQGKQGASFSRLIWEKAPLFALSAVSSIVTVLAQKAGGTVASLETFSLMERVANALMSYVGYMEKMFWPANLAIIYPFSSGALPWWGVAGASVMLALITLVAAAGYRRYPWLTVGWLWYLGTIIPVIGVVQVGVQAMADRYTYVPLIGLFIVISWGVPEILQRWKYKRVGLSIAGVAVLVILMACSYIQTGYWRNSIKLFEHALEVTDSNDVAHSNLASALEDWGDIDGAINHYNEAIKINRRYAAYYNNLGLVLIRKGDLSEAVGVCSKAVQLNPNFPEAYINLGLAFLNQGNINQAFKQFSKVLELDAENPAAHLDMGLCLVKLGRLDEAIYHFRKTLAVQPDSLEALHNLGAAHLYKGRTDEAIEYFQKELKIDPGLPKAYNGIGVALSMKGDTEGAAREYRKALQIDPGNVDARKNLARLLEKAKHDRK